MDLGVELGNSELEMELGEQNLELGTWNLIVVYAVYSST